MQVRDRKNFLDGCRKVEQPVRKYDSTQMYFCAMLDTPLTPPGLDRPAITLQQALQVDSFISPAYSDAHPALSFAGLSALATIQEIAVRINLLGYGAAQQSIKNLNRDLSHFVTRLKQTVAQSPGQVTDHGKLAAALTADSSLDDLIKKIEKVHADKGNASAAYSVLG